MSMALFDQLHPTWRAQLSEFRTQFAVIDRKLSQQHVAPEYSKILRALATPLDDVRVVIIGQDPYPKKGHAHGLAFSVDVSVSPLPATLRNIFKELESDCGAGFVHGGDLSAWSKQGVLLLNRILTTQTEASLAHKEYGWQEITNRVAKILGERNTVAILWGKSAQELAHYFNPEFIIESAHPSPLSAYRGFFGSNPFSRANSLLEKQGHTSINW